MNDLASGTILVAFVVFSRIGACLMLMPGFSSPRIPTQVRLFIAVAFSLGLTPLMLDVLQPMVKEGDPLGLLRLMVSEMLIGGMIGMLGRTYFVALETIAMALSMSIGLSQNLGAPVNEDEPAPALSALLTLGATTLLFVTDQHLAIFRALASSYTAIPVQKGFVPQFAMVQVTDAAATAFTLCLRLGGPFLIFSIVLNLAVGLTNRLVPQIQIFFLASPFLLIGGLLLLSLTVKPMLEQFLQAFGRFLVTG